MISAVHGVGGPGRVWLGSVESDCNRNLVCAAAGPTFVLVSVVGAADHPMRPSAPSTRPRSTSSFRGANRWLAIGRSGHLPANGSEL